MDRTKVSGTFDVGSIPAGAIKPLRQVGVGAFFSFVSATGRRQAHQCSPSQGAEQRNDHIY